MTLDELRASAISTDGRAYRFPPPFWQMAPSLEECEFLYALVRMTRPARVLELGTGYGASAKFIEGALFKNGSGVLCSVEPDEALRAAATELLYPTDRAEVVDRDEAELFDDPNLVFIDSGYQFRDADIEWWLRMSEPFPLVVVHDADRDYPGIEQFGAGIRVPSLSGMWIGRAK